MDTVTIKGREIPIRKLNETQMMLLVREARLLQSSQDVNRKLRSIALMIDIVESAIIDPEDQEWLMGQAGTGNISFGEILQMAAPFEATVDGEVTESRPVRRARARAVTRK